MELLVVAGIGLISGCILGIIISRKNPVGNLRIDNSDPEDGPYLFLELSADPNSIKSKYVTFKVVAKNFISQK